MVYSVTNSIISCKSPNTKTYTNSTWNTSKTWYIKVSFTKNSTSNTGGSNVVNYDTNYVTKRILLYTFSIPTYVLLTKEFILSVPNGTDYYIIRV